eukprot:6470876-Amphidinium_carterae.2
MRLLPPRLLALELSEHVRLVAQILIALGLIAEIMRQYDLNPRKFVGFTQFRKKSREILDPQKKDISPKSKGVIVDEILRSLVSTKFSNYYIIIIIMRARNGMGRGGIEWGWSARIASWASVENTQSPQCGLNEA